jgi:cell division septation protein DedD
MADASANSSTAPPLLTAPAEGPADTPDTTTTLYRAILGEVHTEYYLAAFDRIDAAERWQPQWNWAASLCTLSWLVFRQLWSAALYYAGCVVAGFLLIFGIGGLVLQFSSATELVLAGAFAGALFAVPGLLGTTLLHADCRRRMTLALRASNTDEEARLTLVGQASTRRRMGVLVAINTICVALMGLAASQWLEFSESAGSLARPATTDLTPAAATPAPATPVPTTPSGAEVTSPTIAVSASAPAPVPQTAASSTPLAAIASAPASAPAAGSPTASPAPRPVTGTAGRSAEGPVPWEAMKIAPPRPDITPTPAIEPKKLTIDSPWTGAEKTPKAVRRPASSTSANTATTEKQLLINVGLFAVEDNARKTYNKLDAAGLPATLQPFTTAKGQRFRVRVGPYASRAEADAAAGKIRALALEAVVIESP